MNSRTLAIAASFCLAVASFASAQHCDGCHRGHAVWHGYCDKGCGVADACCDPCCTHRHGILRGIGRVVVGAVRVVDNLIPRPCVNCACSPCGDLCHSGGCDGGCCGSTSGFGEGSVIESGPTPIHEETLPTPASAEATHSIRKTRSVISSNRKKSRPTPARSTRQVSAKPTIESESNVVLADFEQEIADEVPTLEEAPVAPKAVAPKAKTTKAVTVAKKKSESSKKIPVNPLR